MSAPDGQERGQAEPRAEASAEPAPGSGQGDLFPRPAAPRQLVLPLGQGPGAAQGAADFLVSACNAAAVAALGGWRAWPGGRLVLVGPEGSGKSHLVRLWQGESAARVVAAGDLAAADPAALAAGPVAVEDVDAAPARQPEAERALLHLVNLMAAARLPLLLTAREAPARSPSRLPDLASRLAATPIARIAAPDDALVSSLLVKLAADRQLRLPPRVVQHLARRMERSHATIGRVVEALDRASLAENRTISQALASEVLERLASD